MKKNIMTGSYQYSSRPADEKHFTIQDAMKHARKIHQTSRIDDSRYERIVFGLDEDETNLAISTKLNNGTDAVYRLSNLATSQVLEQCGLRHSDVSRYRPETALACIKDVWQKPNGDFSVLATEGTARALYSSRYVPLWDDDLLERLDGLTQDGWKVPPARAQHDGSEVRIASASDILANAGHKGLGVKVGDEIEGSVYLGDRDCFVFLVQDAKPVMMVQGMPYYPAIMVSNGIYGRSLRIQLMLLESVCGNLIAWGCIWSMDCRLRHSANGVGRWSLDENALQQWVELGLKTSNPTKFLDSLVRVELGKTVEESVKAAYAYVGAGQGTITRTILNEAAEGCIEANEKLGTDWKATNAGGLWQGLTYVSQRRKNQSLRADIDTAAARWAAGIAGIKIGDSRLKQDETPEQLLASKVLRQDDGKVYSIPRIQDRSVTLSELMARQ